MIKEIKYYVGFFCWWDTKSLASLLVPVAMTIHIKGL